MVRHLFFIINQNNIIKRLSEATELLPETPRTEVRGFGIISALRADKSAWHDFRAPI